LDRIRNPSPRAVRKLAHHDIPRPTPDALARLPRLPIRVIVEDVRSAHNVGAVLRTADAFRLERVVLCGISALPDVRGVRKTSLGAEDTVPWEHAPSAADALRRARANGYTCAALELTDTPTPVHLAPAGAFPLALVVGNEVEGVSDEALAACELALEIEQWGAKQSLNVSVAFGIAAHALTRRFLVLHPDAL
jgi:tRNA G18 (ribose-2'-O)-methylase SpoU